jgi:glycosyltransferase involved in cell wall biosynthesis
MENILFITATHFHNKIGSGGGKTINYYVNKFSRDYTTTVVDIGDPDNNSVRMFEEYPHVRFILFDKKKNILEKMRDYILCRHVYILLKKYIPFYYISNGFIKRRLKYLLAQVKYPDKIDVVIAEMTPIILHINVIKSLFPNAAFIASCHDVTSQSVERWLTFSRNILFKKWYLHSFKNLERSKLSNYDLLVVHNTKDNYFLQKELGFSENIIHSISPYYDTYTFNADKLNGIVFWGNMKRAENYNAVVWFIENVWRKLRENISKELKLYIVGDGLTDESKSYLNKYKDIVLTGFVDDPSIYFSRVYAMIVPLQTGAGIKIKTIEGLASSIPVISNNIGIEGIPVRDNIEYLHCETANEWVSAIIRIIDDKKLRDKLIVNAKVVISEHFKLEESYINYKNRVLSIQ